MMECGTIDVVHVAEAGENRGRVVLRLTSAAPDRFAVEAALRVARAYQSELESIFIEDQHLVDLCAHPDVVEVSLCGRERRALSPVTLIRQFAYAARQAERRVAVMAGRAEVQYRARTMRDDPVHALNRACAEAGPWNVIALADPVGTRDREAVQRLLGDIIGATGIVLVGAAVRRIDGPVVVVVEDVQRLPLMLRVAERLAAGRPTAERESMIGIVLASADEDQFMAMEASVRMLLGDRADVDIMPVRRAYGQAGALHDALRRLACGFVIGQAGGALLPSDGGWGDFARALECPLFVVR